MSEQPEALGRYVLEARIARGGMGEVFRAAAIGADGFRKPVVIKRVLSHSATPTLRDMFVAEAKLMTRLAHPNIVEVFDFGKGDDGAYFLVMELVRGLDLRAFGQSLRRDQRPFPIPLALLIARETLRGLAFVHTQALGLDKLVHRDISPGNVLLSTLGEVKVADFGVALVAAPDQTQSEALIVGKPAYMAPEQARGEALDGRADLFSLGVVLYELLAGRLPFSDEAIEARHRPKTSADIRSLAVDRPDAPPALAAFLATALAPHPDDRFADARTMLRELDGLRANGLHAATSDELAEAVSEQADASLEEHVIVIGRDIAADHTHVRRGEGGTAFTLSLEGQADERAHRTERLSDPAPGALDAEPGAAAGGTTIARPARVWPWLALAGAVLLTSTGVAYRLADNAPAEADSSTLATSSGAPAPATAASANASAAQPKPALSAAATQVMSQRMSPGVGTALPAVAATASAASCTGSIKLMASHGWAIRGGGAPAEAPGVYSWRCGAYSLRATSRLDQQERSASVVIREDKQAVVDLR